ncbi:MAG: aryldialkylphosphatase [Acidimicrobiia bacterium]|nr:aryldialkylphosphatase [Acidimicrobiia bacterium]
MAFVRTVLGDIAPDQLGLTYAHEHVLLDAPIAADRFPHTLLDDEDAAIAELQACAAVGVGAVVDALPCAIGRDPLRLAAASRRSGVHIIATTGLHTRKWYPGLSWTNELEPAALADLFVADIEKGIDRFDYRGPHVERTPHRAGLIKVGTLQEVPNDRDRRSFSAAAETHHRTGVPILTHCEEGRGGLEQVELFAELGISPDTIVLSHTDKVSDVGYHLELAATGVYLELDQSLRHPIGADNPTVRIVTQLIREGHAGRLMLATDGARRSLWTAYGGEPGLAALAAEVVPVLRNEGVDETALEQLLVTNPARFFAFRDVAA